MSSKRIVKLAGAAVLIGALSLPLSALAQAAPATIPTDLLPAAVELIPNAATLVPLPADWDLARVSLGPFP